MRCARDENVLWLKPSLDRQLLGDCLIGTNGGKSRQNITKPMFRSVRLYMNAACFGVKKRIEGALAVRHFPIGWSWTGRLHPHVLYVFYLHLRLMCSPTRCIYWRIGLPLDLGFFFVEAKKFKQLDFFFVAFVNHLIFLTPATARQLKLASCEVFMEQGS